MFRFSLKTPLPLHRGASLVFLVLWLAACTVPGSPPASAPIASNNDYDIAVKVGLILPGVKDDHAWNQSGYEALMRVQDELKVKVEVREQVAPRQAAAILRELASQDYNLIIAHSGSFQLAIEEVAAEFPNVDFALSNPHLGNNVNLGGLSFADNQIGYLLGYVAGMKTKQNHVAYLAGMAHEDTRRVGTYFVQGAEAARPGVKITVDYVGSWTDEAATAKHFDRLIEAGADVIALYVEAGAVALHQRAATLGIKTIGFSADQYEVAPRAVLTSVINDFTVPFREAVSLSQQGHWEGQRYEFGLKEHAFQLAPFREHLSPEEVRQIEQVQSDILRGHIDLSE